MSTASVDSLESRLAWRWLKQQLSEELGVSFRRGGRQRALNAMAIQAVRVQLAVTPRNRRMEAYRRLAGAYRVSPITIQRVALRAFW
jgi:hypothetical protein